jgi:hypothetical protein
MKRSSAILVPRTFRTPYEVPVPTRVTTPIHEEVEFERKVEFDMSRNVGIDARYRSGSPPGPWIRKENLRERKDKKDIREKEKDSKEREKKDLKEKRDGKEKKDVGKEKDVRKDSGREVKKAPPLPTSVLHGYKYPIPQPKSILKQRTASQSPSIPQQLRSPSTSQQYSGNTSQQPHSPNTSSPDCKPTDEIYFVRQGRQPTDRQKGTPLLTVLISSHLSRRTLESNLERPKHPSKTANNNLK